MSTMSDRDVVKVTDKNNSRVTYQLQMNCPKQKFFSEKKKNLSVLGLNIKIPQMKMSKVCGMCMFVHE